jgi:hypothetical protein
MEANEVGSAEKAAALITMFESRFLAVRFTVHPHNLPGEIAGKSSNVSWAAVKIFEIHRWNKNREDVIITVIDSKSTSHNLISSRYVDLNSFSSY